MVAAGASVWLVTRNPGSPSNAPEETTAATDPSASAGSEPAPTPETYAPLVSRHPTEDVSASIPRTAPVTAARKSGDRNASPYTRQLVASLIELDPKNGPMTPEQIALWKQNLQLLVQQGGAAVPAILEFLDKNVDLSLKGLAGDQLSSSLRQAMFDALAQIGGADGYGGLAQVLQATADPAEIAHLAGMFNVQNSEEYRGVVVDAAREALGHLANMKVQGVEVAPLFELLQKYGGPGVVADLEKAAKNWHHYAVLALANLPEGAGIPALENMIRDRSSAASGSGNSALKLLAQNLHQYPEAAGALERAINEKRIPTGGWLVLAGALGGEVTYFASETIPPDAIYPGETPHEFRVPYGDQKGKSVRKSTMIPGECEQRLAIFDKAIASQPGSVPETFLQRERAKLIALCSK